MGVRFIEDPAGGNDSVAMYDSVTGWTIGPVFSSVEDAQSFLTYLGDDDPRVLTPVELSKRHREWAGQQTL